jgi:nucleotide-binding universal stress UspA family protein
MAETPKIDRILFATDFLGSSRLALDYAVAFAQHFKSTVIMVHALELPNSAQEVETKTRLPSVTRKIACERLEAIARGVRNAGIEVEAFVEDGMPSEVIPHAVEKHAADLLVLGVHGVHRGIAHLLVGSNTENILLSATCPTMTVGAHVLAGVVPSLHFSEILYFSDFTPDATAAAPYAAFLGKEFDAPIDVCQLIPEGAQNNPGLSRALADRYCEAILEVFPDAHPNWRMPSFQLDRGMEVDELIERARSQSAGLIILGIRAESHLGRHLHTSFAYQLLANATCPVVSVRRQSPGTSKINSQSPLSERALMTAGVALPGDVNGIL